MTQCLIVSGRGENVAKYIDIQVIGSGGFGVVFKCRCDADNNIYAKKKLGPSADKDAARRFTREVNILSKLDHPNIVQVVARRLQTPPFYYIMPLFQQSLSSELPSLSGDQQRIYIKYPQILDAIDYAHSQG
jgi:serine/threonine protein kinase